MKIRTAVVSLVCAFLIISSAPASAGTCSPRLIKQYFPQFPYVYSCPDTRQPNVRVINARVIGNLAYLSVVHGLWCETGYPSRFLQIVDISDPENPVQLGSYGSVSEPVGSLYYVSGGTAYMGGPGGSLLLIDVTNPAAPTPAARYDSGGWITDVYVSGNIAYVADMYRGLHILDVSNPRQPALIGSLYWGNSVARAIFVSGNTAYITGGIGIPGTWGSAFYPIDITNPRLPRLLASYELPRPGRIYVARNTAYAAADIAGLLLFDITNPAAPIPQGIYQDLPDMSAQDVEVYNNIGYVAGAGKGLQVIDVSNPNAPSLMGSYVSPQINSHEYGYGVDVSVSGNVAYMADGVNGLQIIDIGCCAGDSNTPPATTIVVSSSPNQAGWYNTDVSISLEAADNEGGTGVREIHYKLTGAVSQEGTIPGASAHLSITAEGSTRLTYYSVDNAGNAEEPRSLEIKIDKTPPVITAGVSPQPNSNGWNNADVMVTFTANDALSGVAAVSSPVTVITEGRDQQVGGEAIDRAGNRATTSVILNLDKTPPQINVTANPNILWPPNHKMAPVTIGGRAADALSGIDKTTFDVKDEYGKFQPIIPAFNSVIQLEAWRDGNDQDGRVYTVNAAAKDKAGNQASASTVITCPHDQGKK